MNIVFQSWRRQCSEILIIIGRPRTLKRRNTFRIQPGNICALEKKIFVPWERKCWHLSRSSLHKAPWYHPASCRLPVRRGRWWWADRQTAWEQPENQRLMGLIRHPVINNLSLTRNTTGPASFRLQPVAVTKGRQRTSMVGLNLHWY